MTIALYPCMSLPCCASVSARKTSQGVRRVLRHRRHAFGIRAAGMLVPSDSFGGRSPEKKAADLLRTLFTFCAARIVLAQLEGSGRGSLASYNAEAYDALTTMLQDEPMRDGDAWLEKLLTRNEMLALRIMEVRAAYCKDDFEWHMVQSLANKDMGGANVALLRSNAENSFKRSSSMQQRDAPGQ
ncbi:hypothetical protein CVIRNUC_010699 [Coccomyxa viridis]|uniref:Uncharacterized protein n=1 Tax=Coccomyxa viridis TaxID=1274662 RepID=A0AAV1IK20_9CHLO|nr:hypothetical protein CVIRNUC_010699 [Coccomyxa viridis]